MTSDDEIMYEQGNASPSDSEANDLDPSNDQNVVEQGSADSASQATGSAAASSEGVASNSGSLTADVGDAPANGASSGAKRATAADPAKDRHVGAQQPPTESASATAPRRVPDISVEARDPDAAVLLSALQTVYMDKLRPLEEKWYFSQFHHDAMTVADLQSKPQVLLLGQYSTGKTTFIKHFIGRDFPSMHIGPEPSTEAFQAVMAGSEDRIIKGTALCLIDELPFTGLSRFGAAFLNHFEASICDAEILEHITFVDTPGVLVSGKQGDQRGYSFAHAVKWFADRSDMILLVFDVHKLDISEEFRQLIGALGAHAEKLRIVLNKAQEVDADRLIKVFGALMWGVGRAFKHKSEVPKVYVGSFWDGPKRHPDSPPEDETFAEDEALLRREMMQLPRNVGLRKINEMTKRAKLAKVHACILDHLRSQMPWYGAEAAQQRLMEQLPEVFTAVKRKYGFPDGDMPDIERYRAVLPSFSFSALPRLDRATLRALDDIIERDIKQVVARGGGVNRIFKVTSEVKVVAPSPEGGMRRRRSAAPSRRVSAATSGVAGSSHGSSAASLRRTRSGRSSSGGSSARRGWAAWAALSLAQCLQFVVLCALLGLGGGALMLWLMGHDVGGYAAQLGGGGAAAAPRRRCARRCGACGNERRHRCRCSTAGLPAHLNSGRGAVQAVATAAASAAPCCALVYLNFYFKCRPQRWLRRDVKGGGGAAARCVRAVSILSARL